jgi:epsilon-lactone hydrolase
MPSIRARLLISLLKHRHLFRGRLRRPVIDRNTSMTELRDSAERAVARFSGLPKGVDIEPFTIETTNTADLAAEWIKPEGCDHTSTILYFHGGGYVVGSLNSHRGAVAKFVRKSGIRALHFQYRLAPEHPFPAALDDAIAAYSWLLAQGARAEKIVFLGDSAGGGLCLATLLALQDREITLPAGACAMSPWTDLACTGNSYSRKDDLAPEGSFQVFSSHYAQSHPVNHPLISPLYGDLAGLPPLMLCAGDAEAMMDDSTRFAAKAEAAGVRVRLLLGKGMIHCYPVFSPLFPEAQQALEEICGFLQQILTPDKGINGHL